MQQQLDLWHDAQKPHQALDTWEGLDQQQRRKVIEALARLISKAVHPEPNNPQEKINEE